MKKIILSLFVAFSATFILHAQVPQSINYQAVVRNNTGDVVKNQSVRFRLSVTEGLNGTTVYSETQQVTTNLLGLVNFSIGTGTIVSGALSSIAWNLGQKYLKIEVDVAGGSNFVLMGSQAFVTVPYAFYAEKANIAGSVANQWQFNNVGIHYNQGKVGIGTLNPSRQLEFK